jgi:molybdenum cofactor biosynthesis enzyme MoaA
MARATYYRESRGSPKTVRLRERIREVALSEAAFGYRRITAVLRRQGWQINPISAHHCSTCNRLRLTAAGALRPCLFAETEIDLKNPLRQGASEGLLASVFAEPSAKKSADLLCPPLNSLSTALPWSVSAANRGSSATQD